MREPTGSLLKSAPKRFFSLASGIHGNLRLIFISLQAAWVQGRYEAMWLGCLRAQVDGRYFPISDHHIRGFSIIGEAERCLQLFQQLYRSIIPAEFQLGASAIYCLWLLVVSQLPQAFVNTWLSHFDHFLRQKCRL